MVPEAPSCRPTPITLLTGFLGSGKTTLFSRLLKSPEAGRVAAIVNEFGEIDLDHDLLEASSEDVVVLGNGCLCCAMRGSLADTLRDLDARRQRDVRYAFDRAVIETSGLGDPVPVLRLLLGDAWIAETFTVAGVVTLVDAAHGQRTLAEHPEARAQVRVADVLVLSKIDVAEAPAVDALEATLTALNPGAPRVRAVRGAVDPDVVLRPDRLDASSLAWRPVGRSTGVTGIGATHTDGVRTVSFRFARPLSAADLDRLLAVLRSLAGPDLLRAKGIFVLQGDATPVAVQAVQDAVHTPERLPWLVGQRGSGLVLIGRQLSEAALAELASLAQG